MLKYPCLVLDHDDTVVQSEATINYPFFCEFLTRFRPGASISLKQYTEGCFHLGFAEMCRQWFAFTQEDLTEEYLLWREYIRTHIPFPYPGIERVIRQQKASGGVICVVSHSCTENITRDYQTHFGLVPDDIFGWDLPEALRKPSPYPLEQIMAKYHLSPKELLVVDDMKPAWEMASKVGVDIAFAGWSRKDFPEISQEMTRLCKYSFSSPKDLEHFLFS